MIDASTIEQFVSDTREHPEADFYRNTWGSAKTFNELPYVSREMLAQCELSRRSYKKEQGLVRMVHSSGGPLLIAWGFSDIAREPYGVSSKRPLIYFTDSHDTVEKSMWSYLNHMVPLAGEKNITVTELAARAFEVDSLIADPVSIAELLPYLEGRTEPLASISIVGHSFNPEYLKRYQSLARKIRLVLALPETGAFAAAELSEHPRFTLLENCHVETGEQTIVLTKYAPLITPIIRMNTGIPFTVISGQ